jgi:AcrR family transcriptional regulator
VTSDQPTSTSVDSPPTKEAIVQATYRALRKHGYSDLAVADIAAEFDKSKSLIYYHYDSKDDLLLELLTYATDQFFKDIDANTGQGHQNDLSYVLTLLLPQSLSAGRHDAQQILFGLRARALVDGAYRVQFTRFDERIARRIEDVVAGGIAADVFETADPACIADHVLATVNGAALQRLTTHRNECVEYACRGLEGYLSAELGVSL